MTGRLSDRSHPVLATVRRVSEELEGLTFSSTCFLSPGEQRDVLRELARVEARVAALRLNVLAEAERSGAGQERGAASVADWVAIETRQTRISARSDLKLATALEGFGVLAQALDEGHANVAQARAIVTALDRLPGSGEFAVSLEQREQAERHLVELAQHHDAKALAVLGRRLFEVVAPDLAEAYEGKVLADEEALASRRVMFAMREDAAGTCHGTFRIPVLHGQWLNKMVMALASPVRHTPSDIDESLPTEVRHGHAFCQLIEAVPATSLPKAGGCGATVVVTMTLEQLLADLETAGVCTLDTGGRISAAEARRLACRSGIVPAVLGGRSQVLDLGRRSRVYSEYQRIAMGLTQGGCTAEHCDRPPAMCHAHHDRPWSQGGRTDLGTGRLLCGHHHRRIHDPRYRATRQPDGRVSFHRRT